MTCGVEATCDQPGAAFEVVRMTVSSGGMPEVTMCGFEAFQTLAHDYAHCAHHGTCAAPAMQPVRCRWTAGTAWLDCATVGHPASIVLLLIFFLLRVVGGGGLVLCVDSDGRASLEFVGNTCCSEDEPSAPVGDHEHQVSDEQCQCQDTLVAPTPAVTPPSHADSAPILVAHLESSLPLDLELPSPSSHAAAPAPPPAHELGHPPSTVVLRL